MTDKNLNIDVTVDDGKYRFTQTKAGSIIVYRHGEEWIVGSFAGVNMVIAMACEIEELRAREARRRERLKVAREKKLS